MKEIKAYLHRWQIGNVIQALKDGHCWGADASGACRNVAVYQVQGTLTPSDSREEHYSVALSEIVTYEYKIELVCEDAEADKLVQIVRDAAAGGGRHCGWIFVVNVERAVEIA